MREGAGTMISVGANIKARRRALGMNQEELARRLGLTQANISRIEANVKGPNALLEQLLMQCIKELNFLFQKIKF